MTNHFLTSSKFDDSVATTCDSQPIIVSASDKSGSHGGGRLLRNASESPTFVAFTLALFVFLSALSMMTAAQSGPFNEASFQQTPIFSQELERGAGKSNADECYGDSACSPCYTFAAFDYTAFRDAMRIGRKSAHARHFDARGPPAAG